ncbi:hypothetical protein GW853_02965 [Candidatus Kuenenbacteria bacterium]|nr:hypothetical protein [Candidatus Kuenenbacteria bacterium]
MSPYISYLYSLIIIAGLELSLFKPNFFWWAALLILFFNVFFVWLAARVKFNLNFWNYLISPFLFLLSGLMFLAFSGKWLDNTAINWVIYELIVLLLVTANTIFLYRLITYSYHKYKYKEHSLSTISRIINITSIFFWCVSAFNFQVFLKIPIWLLVIASALVMSLIIYQFFSISKIKFSTSKIFVLVLTGLLLELFYVLTWLPILSVVKGILITSAYYFITSLCRHYIQSTLAQTVWLRYLLATGIIWLMTVLTARWE